MRGGGWISTAQAEALERIQGGRKDPCGVSCKEIIQETGQRQQVCDDCVALLGWGEPPPGKAAQPGDLEGGKKKRLSLDQSDSR